MRILTGNNEADTKMITMVIGLLIVIAISVLIFYNIQASIDYTNVNNDIAENVYGLTYPAATPALNASYNNTAPATNASENLNDQAATFYQLAPLIAVVIVAVVIIGYVSKI